MQLRLIAYINDYLQFPNYILFPFLITMGIEGLMGDFVRLSYVLKIQEYTFLKSSHNNL